jgi:predicted nucleic acid-binding protein
MIISNTTPLINFATIERLDILEQLFDSIIIPVAVKNELIEKGNLFPALKTIQNSDFISISKIKDIRLNNSFKIDLDEGEAEVLTLAIERNAELILLDELTARKIAKFHEVNFIGSIGCLVLAKRNGIIINIKPLLDLMREKARFWINQKLYERILFDNQE